MPLNTNDYDAHYKDLEGGAQKLRVTEGNWG